MEQTVENTMLTRGHVPQITLARGMRWGYIGGLVGTMAMDLTLMGVLSAVGLPAFTCFSIVGDTVAHFFSNLGIHLAGGAPMGIAAHYLVGPLFGIIFSLILGKVDSLHIDSLKKGVLLAVIYVEIMSQPILVTTPILLKMTAKATLIWFGGSFVMHFIYGVVLGVIMSYGLRLTNHQAIND
jgi:hypothetical protein